MATPLNSGVNQKKMYPAIINIWEMIKENKRNTNVRAQRFMQAVE